jgi:hypothetical protein
MSESIEFAATIAKVQTMVDMGIRVTLDLWEGDIIPAAWIMEAKRLGVILHIVASFDKQEENNGEGTVEAGSKRKSRWETAKG